MVTEYIPATLPSAHGPMTNDRRPITLPKWLHSLRHIHPDEFFRICSWSGWLTDMLETSIQACLGAVHGVCQGWSRPEYSEGFNPSCEGDVRRWDSSRLWLVWCARLYACGTNDGKHRYLRQRESYGWITQNGRRIGSVRQVLPRKAISR